MLTYHFNQIVEKVYKNEIFVAIIIATNTIHNYSDILTIYIYYLL